MGLKQIQKITEIIIQSGNNGICRETAREIAGLSHSEVLELLTCANRIRRHFKKDSIFTCGIVNAKSGRCSENCAFCAQSSHHKAVVNTYSLLDEQTLVDKALELKNQGATRYSMVSSGLKLSLKELDTVCKATETIIALTGMTVCASLGILTTDMARKLRQSGITNYHHNIETAPSYFDKICTTHDYDLDIETVHIAADSGMRICCGGILGLGETWDQRTELALTIKGLPTESVPLNFLNPIFGTRLEHQPLLHPIDALKCIALFRFILPNRDITICGGREVTLKGFQSLIFHAGANGLMVGNYLTTEGRNIGMDLEMIRDLGLCIENDA